MSQNATKKVMGTEEKVKNIKRSFRLYMNGEAARSMREKGLDYKLIWGVPLANLKTMAAEYGYDYDLAMALWKENIRECKILAMLVMPVADMTKQLAESWVKDMRTVEAAELCMFTLFRHLPFAKNLACEWIESEKVLTRICAYHLFSRLFSATLCSDSVLVQRLLDSVEKDIVSVDASLRHAASNCLNRFMSVGTECEAKGEAILDKLQ